MNPQQLKDFLRQFIALPGTRTAIGLFSLLLVLLTWSISSPVGSSPDDDFHLASAYCGQGIRKDLCEPGSSTLERRVPYGIIHAHDCYRDPLTSAECLDTGKVLENPVLGYFTPNTRNLYPKLFYFASSTLAGTNVKNSVALMRLLNVMIVFTLFTFTYLTVSRKLQKALILSWCLTSVPLGLFLFASNNPSSWSLAAISVFWVNIVSFFEAQTRRGKSLAALGSFTSAIIALGARADSGPFLSIALIFSLFYCWPIIDRTKRRATMASSMALIAILIWATRAGSQSSVIQDGLTGTSSKRPSQGVLQYNLENIVNIIFGNFGYNGSKGLLGNLGWFNTPIPTTASVLLLSIFVVFSVVLYSKSEVRGKISMISLLIISVALPLRILQIDHLHVGDFVQPRYVLSLLYLLIGFGVVHAKRVKLSKDLQLITVTILTLAHSLCLHACIRRYISNYTSDYGANYFDLNRHILWWSNYGLSPSFTWAIGTIAFGIFSSLAILSPGTFSLVAGKRAIDSFSKK
jgi:hypothetical protein